MNGSPSTNMLCGATARPVVALQPTYAERRTPRRLKLTALIAAVVAIGLPLLGLAHAHHGFLIVNTTPSEPPGLYVRAAGAPVRAGALIAFLVPPSAFPYADRWMAYLHTMPILKAVVATAGDNVCTDGGVLTIKGIRYGSIAQRDRHGRTLPHWNGCRSLAPGEVFVFSDRVPSSFDSRYFGPVSVASAEVYRPLATTDGLGR